MKRQQKIHFYIIIYIYTLYETKTNILVGVLSYYERKTPFPHAGTFHNNIMTMTAGLAGLSQLFTPVACVRLNNMGDNFRDRLNVFEKRFFQHFWYYQQILKMYILKTRFLKMFLMKQNTEYLLVPGEFQQSGFLVGMK